MSTEARPRRAGGASRIIADDSQVRRAVDPSLFNEHTEPRPRRAGGASLTIAADSQVRGADDDRLRTRVALDALLEQQDEAQDAGALGYLARVMVQATMPHSRPAGHEFTRRNGALTLTIMAPSTVGLPYGTVPRLLLAWLTTEAVRTKSPQLTLGATLSSFMRELDLIPNSGGPRGDSTRLRSQMRRLFSAAVSCNYSDATHDAIRTMTVADEANLWWDPRRPDQAALWNSTVTLSARFFEEVVTRPIPVDLHALRALRRSPLALDAYAWLTYRMSYLHKPATIPWESLELQFGADYRLTRQFRAAFVAALAKVVAVYPAARVTPTPAGLFLLPSRTSIPPRT